MSNRMHLFDIEISLRNSGGRFLFSVLNAGKTFAYLDSDLLLEVFVRHIEVLRDEEDVVLRVAELRAFYMRISC